MADYNKDFKRPATEPLAEEAIETNSTSTTGLWSLVEKTLELVKDEGLTTRAAIQRDAVTEKIDSFTASDHSESFSIALMKERLPK